MPRTGSPHTKMAALSSFDARAWSGTPLFTQGSDVTTMTTFTGAGDGIYEDVIAFLNARGSRSGMSLPEQIVTHGTGAGTWDIYLNDEDRVVVSNTADTFTAAGDVFGFTGGATSAILDGGVYYATAPSDFTRGVIAGLDLNLVPGASAAFAIPAAQGFQAQSIITMLRSYADAGAPAWDCMEEMHYDATLITSVRWGLTETGHVYTTSQVGHGMLTTMTWNSPTMRDRLGFSGEEVAVDIGGIRILTAAYPCPGVIVPSRPPHMVDRQSYEVGKAQQLRDATYAAVNRGYYHRFTVTGNLSGPVGNDIRLDVHWMRNARNYFYQGAPVVYYQDWGETRRRSFDVTTGYTTRYTVQSAGEMGRIHGHISSTNSSKEKVSWETSLKMLFRYTIVIDELLED